jgi:COMPASS component SWD1
MNLSLVDPFILAQDCPEVITGRLRTCSPSLPLSLSTPCVRPVTHNPQAAAIRRRSASAIAATCSPLAVYAPFSRTRWPPLTALQHDGIVVIFDIETNGVARKLRGHTRQVQSLSWSTNDRYLLSAGQDWKVVLWDLNDGSRVRTVRFEAAIFIAELHPKNQSVQPMLAMLALAKWI